MLCMLHTPTSSSAYQEWILQENSFQPHPASHFAKCQSWQFPINIIIAQSAVTASIYLMTSSFSISSPIACSPSSSFYTFFPGLGFFFKLLLVEHSKTRAWICLFCGFFFGALSDLISFQHFRSDEEKPNRIRISTTTKKVGFHFGGKTFARAFQSSIWRVGYIYYKVDETNKKKTKRNDKTMQKMVTLQQSTSIDAHENCQIIARTRLCKTSHLIEKEGMTTGRTAWTSVYSQVDLCFGWYFYFLASTDPIFVSQAAYIGHFGANFTACIL